MVPIAARPTVYFILLYAVELLPRRGLSTDQDCGTQNAKIFAVSVHYQGVHVTSASNQPPQLSNTNHKDPTITRYFFFSTWDTKRVAATACVTTFFRRMHFFETSTTSPPPNRAPQSSKASFYASISAAITAPCTLGKSTCTLGKIRQSFSLASNAYW